MVLYRVYLEVEINRVGCVAVVTSQHIHSRVVSLVRAITLIVPHYEPLIQVIGLRLLKKVSLALCWNLHLLRSPPIMLLSNKQAVHIPMLSQMQYTPQPIKHFAP